MTLLKTWNPCAFLSANGIGYNYAILVLNRQILVPFSKCRLLNLWENANVRVTVDGGTDQWLWWLERNNISADVKKPDLVTGDMDSIQKETLDLLSCSKYCKVIVTEDQDETDFTKALKELKKYVKCCGKQIDFVLVLSEDTGRFDQIIANVNTLHKAANFLSNVDIYMITAESLTWLLWSGSHKIVVSPSVLQYSKWCSLIPFGSSAYITTTGLKWNLMLLHANTLCAYGQMISTSNAFTDSPEVTVITDNPVVWSMGVNSKVINS